MMSESTNLKPKDMFRILLTICLYFALGTDVVALVTFDEPPSGGFTVTIAEDKQVGSVIYTLQATDPAGHVPVFTKLTQNPPTPAFSIDAGDNLIVPTQGLDAETATEYTFTFRVEAGSSTADSGVLTVHVTDVNDNGPAFNNTPYTGEVWKNDPAGTSIATVTASDPDISNLTITYSIAGAQTTFSVNGSGVISLATSAGLTSLSSPTVLQVQASDGGRTGTAAVTVTIKDDPCSAGNDPCQNGGTCNSTQGNYTCACLSGYDGDECESVDYCYQGPCQNNGTCMNEASNYTCNCTSSFTGQNCTEPITTISTTPPTTPTTTPASTPPTTPPTTPTETTPTSTTTPKSTIGTTPHTTPRAYIPSPKSVDTGLIVAIVVIVLCALCIVAVIVILKKSENKVDQSETNQDNVNTTDEENITYRSLEHEEGGSRIPTKQTSL